jgi:hypothetical protein
MWRWSGHRVIVLESAQRVAEALQDGQALNAYGLGIAQQFPEMVQMYRLERGLQEMILAASYPPKPKGAPNAQDSLPATDVVSL